MLSQVENFKVVSNLEQLIKKTYPNYKEIISLVLDGKSEYTVFLNAGHGGINPEIEKQLVEEGRTNELYNHYTTRKNGDGKCFEHFQLINGRKQLYSNNNVAGALLNFHACGWFFEGVENRIYVKKLIDVLKQEVLAGNLNIVVVSHEWQDTTRLTRINVANAIFAAQKKNNQKSRALWVGWHFNASSNHDANGVCIFTSNGKSFSDQVAEKVIDNYLLEGFKHYDSEKAKKGIAQVESIRTQNSDGDKDHEANFDELAKTSMPAILVEGGFFDQIKDAEKIHYDDSYKTRSILAVVNAIKADANKLIK